MKIPKRVTTKQFRIILIASGSVLLLLVALWFWLLHGLPDKQAIQSYRVPSTVSSLAEVDWQNLEGPVRKVVPLNAIAEDLQQAVIISEDDLFWQHDGINFTMLKEAFKVNWQRKRYARGASTITMQLARNAFLTKEKSLIRKLKEVIVTRRIEQALSKKQILEHYLNLIEWGENVYGAEAASHYYYGKPASRLTLAEASVMAAILPNPVRFTPFTRMETVKKFQKRVLELMALSRVIDQETAEVAYQRPIALRGQSGTRWTFSDSSGLNLERITQFAPMRSNQSAPLSYSKSSSDTTDEIQTDSVATSAGDSLQ